MHSRGGRNDWEETPDRRANEAEWEATPSVRGASMTPSTRDRDATPSTRARSMTPTSNLGNSGWDWDASLAADITKPSSSGNKSKWIYGFNDRMTLLIILRMMWRIDTNECGIMVHFMMQQSCGKNT